MKYGELLGQMNRHVEEAGIQDHPDLFESAHMVSETLQVAITRNDPVLRELPPGTPLNAEIEIDDQTASDALETFNAAVRERIAGMNLAKLLDKREMMTFDELLEVLRTARNADERYRLVSQRSYMKNIPPSSPLYPLIRCILERRINFAEVMEQELQDNGVMDEDLIDPHDKPITEMFDRFRALLGECMAQPTNAL